MSRWSLLLLAVTSLASATGWRWHDGAPLDPPRAAHAAAWCGGRLVIAGGSWWPDPQTKVRLDRVEAYDPVTDRWSRLPDLPVAVSGAGGAAVAGQFVVVGGFDGQTARRDVWRLTADGWQPGPPLPQGRCLHAVAAIGARIFVVGGCAREDNLAGLSGDGWCWDTAGEPVWRPIAGIPGRVTAAVTASDEDLYVFGGARLLDGQVTNRADAWRYDPALDRWTRLADLPVPVRGAAAVAVGDAVLVLGGYTGQTRTGFTAAVVRYDEGPARYDWVDRLPAPIGVTPFVWTGAQLLVAGGEDRAKSRSGRVLVADPEPAAGRGGRRLGP